MKREGESFSDLFERMLKESSSYSSIEVLKRLRTGVEFRERAEFLLELKALRPERRI